MTEVGLMPETQPTQPELIISTTANEDQKAALRQFNFVAVTSYPNQEILNDSIKLIMALGAHKKASFDPTTDEIIDNDPLMQSFAAERKNASSDSAKEIAWRKIVNQQFSLVAGRLAIAGEVEVEEIRNNEATSEDHPEENAI